MSVSNNSQFCKSKESDFVTENFKMGSKYIGYKKNGMRDGDGKFYYQDGALYEGSWV